MNLAVNYKLFNEYNNLTKTFVATALTKENKVNNYLSNLASINNVTGEFYNLSFSYKKYITKQYNNILQKIMYNKVIARQNNLIPIFITFTLPSSFHPFKQKPYKMGNKINSKNYFINNFFEYNSIKEAIKEGYNFLNGIWRTYYLRLKNNKKYKKNSKNIRYDLFYEYHKSYIPHLHVLLYIPSEMLNYAYKAFNSLLIENNMEQRANKFIEIKTTKQKGKRELKNLDAAVLYISKYIKKGLENIKKDYVSLLQYVGFKSLIGRIYRGSNTKLTLQIYNKIYYSLSEKEKEVLLKRAKNNNTCLLYELEQITNIKKTTYSNNKVKTKEHKPKKYNKYYVDIKKEKVVKKDNMSMIMWLKNNTNITLANLLKNKQDVEMLYKFYKKVELRKLEKEKEQLIKAIKSTKATLKTKFVLNGKKWVVIVDDLWEEFEVMEQHLNNLKQQLKNIKQKIKELKTQFYSYYYKLLTLQIYKLNINNNSYTQIYNNKDFSILLN